MNRPPSNTDSLDLHGYTVDEAIERFVAEYNSRVKNGQLDGWTLIHGYGSSGQGGAIRTKLRAFLAKHAGALRSEAGDDYGNPGWTWVYPRLRLPDRRERLTLAILEFCATPRVEEKILREFAVQGGVPTKELIRSLTKAGRMKTVIQGAKFRYQAA